jgi:hypothetical protein
MNQIKNFLTELCKFEKNCEFLVRGTRIMLDIKNTNATFAFRLVKKHFPEATMFSATDESVKFYLY